MAEKKTSKKVEEDSAKATVLKKNVKESKDVAKVKNSEPIAKAGKRSAKAVKETVEKLVKEEKKKATKAQTDTKTTLRTQKPARTKLERRSKKYKKVAGLIDPDKSYELKDAVNLAIKTNFTKFDASVELHVKLAVDPKIADQNIRESIVLPSGTGNEVKIAVFTEDDPGTLKKAGAYEVGTDTILDKLARENIDFDLLVTSPQMMAKIAKFARVLGPKGLMPNPKSGTVTKDLVKAVSQLKKGKVEYRVDPTGIIHLAVGKVSFGNEKLLANLSEVLKSIKSAKPSTVKSSFVQSVHITTSMGPGIKVNYS